MVKKISNKRWAIVSGLLIVIVVLALAIIATKPASKSTPSTHKVGTGKIKTPSDKSNNNTSGLTPTNPKSESTSSTQTPSNSTNNSGASINIITPSGTFVSSHDVNESSLINSECTTNPNIECTISFTNTSTGQIITLPSKTTNSDGVADWEAWSPQNYNIPAGIYVVKATASSGGSNKTSTDPKNFTVT